MPKFYDWLDIQDLDFKKEIGADLNHFWNRKLTLKELEALDNRFINNSPEGDNDRASNGTSD